MAKLTRKHQKVFASSASNNGQFGSAQAGTKIEDNDLDVIQALAAFLTGWEDAVATGKLPTLEEMQGLQYMQTYQLAYLFQEGIPEWNTSAEYHQNSIVKKIGTYELYGSKTNTNTGNALPSQADNTDWEYLGDLSGSITNNGTPVDNEIITYDGTSGGIIQPSGFVMPTSDSDAGKPLVTDGAGELTFDVAEYFAESSALTLSTGDQDYSFSHGLGMIPKRFSAVVKCTTASNGFSLDDEIDITNVFQAGTGGTQTVANATTVKLIQDANPVYISDDTTTPSALPVANWDLYLRAWKY